MEVLNTLTRVCLQKDEKEDNSQPLIGTGGTLLINKYENRLTPQIQNEYQHIRFIFIFYARRVMNSQNAHRDDVAIIAILLLYYRSAISTHTHTHDGVWVVLIPPSLCHI